MVLLDTTPLQTDHRFRGIGRHVEGLSRALDGTAACSSIRRVGLDLPGAPANLAYRITPEPENTRLWRRARSQARALERLFPKEVEKGTKIFHATDPAAIPRGMAGMRICVTVYDVIPFLFPKILGHLALPNRLFWRLWVPHRLRQADAIVAISQEVKRTATQIWKLDPNKVHVVYPGVESRPQREPHDIHGPLLYVGAADRHKNLDTLLAAFARVLQADPTRKLVMVGKIPHSRLEDLCALAGTLGLADAVQWLGYVPDEELGRLYTQASVFVFPSLAEGFGLPVLEAMARGCPVVCSNASCLPEVAANAAVLVDPTNPQALSHELLSLLSNPERIQTLRASGWARVEEFSWRRTALGHLGVWQKNARVV